MTNEIFISVDVETAGPIPGEYSLLSIGACLVHDDQKTFYTELKPINFKAVPQALEVSGLSLEVLKKNGQDPILAMKALSQWLSTLPPNKEDKFVFVGFNAAFDWSFINYYFHKFIGGNPFGFTALDIKSYYMGATGCNWNDTRSSQIALKLNPKSKSDHNALQDAKYQAEVFRLIEKHISSQ